MRLTDVKYWDAVWGADELPPPIDVRQHRLNDLMYRRLHDAMRGRLAALGRRGGKLLEVGCAKSVWLPYFARELGFEVTGLDYSARGCAQARAILARDGVDGAVLEGDVFAPPEALLGRFDVVFSFGLVEHFTPTADCVTALCRLLKPGGVIITVIPNLGGLMGAFQRWINDPVYRRHVVLTDETLRAAHAAAGFEKLRCDYFFAVNFGWINEVGAPPTRLLLAKKRVLSLVRHLSRATWLFEELTRPLPPSVWLSPAVLCIGQKPV